MTVGPGPTRIGNIENYLEKIKKLEVQNEELIEALEEIAAPPIVIESVMWFINRAHKALAAVEANAGRGREGEGG